MASSVKRNNELFPLVVAGDAKAREALIEENMALVVVKVDAFIAQVPGVAHLRDDLISAGHIGLVNVVNKVSLGASKKIYALNKCISDWVGRELWRLLGKEHVIHIPRESSRRRRNNGDPIPIPVVLHAIPESLETPATHSAVDLEDMLAACCKSDLDRACLRLRRERYTLKEIAARLDVPLLTVHRRLRRLKARIRERLQ